MKKLIIWAVAMACLLSSGCRLGESFNTHQLKPGNISRAQPSTYAWRFDDLGSGRGESLLQAAPNAPLGHMLMVKDQNGTIVSQINIIPKIFGIITLNDPTNGRPWMFLSVNDQKRTWVQAYHYVWERRLKREEKVFEAIPRTDAYINRTDNEWNGLIYPQLLEDLDGDGRPDLICLAIDGYTINPRGLVVYDFDSGKLKWRFDLTTSIYSVVCDDFDGDGSKELVCGNYAPKNTELAKNGMDDFNTWLMVLNSRGQLKYYEKVNEGFGEVLLAADDLDLDGRKEILSVCSTQGNADIPNSVLALRWTGERLVRLKSWSMPGCFDQNIRESIYNSLDGSGTKRFLLAARNSPLVVLDNELKQVRHDFKDIVTLVWEVEDIDQDSNKEILLQTADNHFVILDSNLNETARIRNPFDDDAYCTAHIVKTGFGKDSQIALVTNSEIRYYTYHRLPLYVLAWHFVKANSLYLSLLLALAFLALLALFMLRRNSVFKTLDKLNEGVILLGRKGRIFLYNNHALDLLRDPQGKIPDLSSRSLRVLIPQLYRLLEIFVGSKARESSVPITLGADKLPYTATFQRMHGMFLKYMIILKPDLAEKDLESGKLLWADTARRLSHNVRRHITNIILALKPLQEATLPEDLGSYPEIIRSEIEKIRVFTHAFQRFTELRDYDLKLQDVIPSVEHCLQRFTWSANINLIKNWGLESVETWLEPIRFEEALSNIVGNALEAMPDGGNLHITVKSFPGSEGPRGKTSVLIEVEDSGPGIPSKYTDEVWLPFFTTKDSGTGIGLPESRKIIESMGGKIEIQSEEGAGTVVSIWLRGQGD
jgi:signal transduction histidine kinase